MKVYVLHYSCWDKKEIVGVFTTIEMANIWVDDMVERDKKLYSEDSIRSHYSITEEDLIG